MHAFMEGGAALSPEMTVGLLGVIALGVGAMWLFVRWLFQGPRQPEPWGQEVEEELAKEETVALCHRCLSPHSHLADFCPECGAPVGDYTNLLPYPYLFSIGHTLRIGTSGEFLHRPLTVVGFVLLGIAEYTFLAPVYWFFFVRGLTKPASRDSAEGDPVTPG